MADYYTEVVVEPFIPKALISEQDLKWLRLYGFQNQMVVTEEGEGIYLYAPEYSCSAWDLVEEEDGPHQVEFDEDMLHAFFQRVIDASKGRLKYLCLHAACTCSKPRPDGFGGWVTFLTKDDQRHMNTWQIAEGFKRRAERREAHGEKANGAVAVSS
jgi:hypothetical protein